MRILYLCHSFPFPPTKGEKLRAFEQLDFLGRRHHVHLLSLGSPEEIRKHRAGLREHCAEVEGFPLSRLRGSLRAAVGILGAKPLTLSFFHSSALRKRIRELNASADFDLVFVSGSSMAPYAAFVDGTPRLLDMVDVDSAKWAQYARSARFPRRFVYRLEARRLRTFEASLGKWFERVVLTTHHETRLLRSFAPDIESAAVPVGIDPRKWPPANLPKSEVPTLVFTGQMDYFPNVDAVCHFAHHLFPELRRQIPNLEFVIVGRSPSRRVRVLGRIEGVRVTGEVKDVRPFLASATIFVAPLRVAQGVQVKVLEAMASGLPVICTPCVMNGIADSGIVDREHILVGPDDDTFSALVLELVDDRKLREQLAGNAKQQILSSHSSNGGMERLERIVAQAVNTAASSELPSKRARRHTTHREARIA